MRETQKKTLAFCTVYLGFISLGLPDSVLGVAWPDMRAFFGRPLTSAGLLLFLTTACSIGSSLAAGYLGEKVKTNVILSVSGFLTGAAMFGYALSPMWLMTLLFTLPLGAGQGAVDATLNTYVAKNYSSRHMNWLHCCWGIGATAGPLIMTAVIGSGLSWREGYCALALIQTALAVLFLAAGGLWENREKPARGEEQEEREKRANSSREKAEPGAWEKSLRFRAAAVAGCLFYFLYPGLEAVAGLWGASFLIERAGVPLKSAGLTLSLYWASLTAGRFCVGIWSDRFADKGIIRAGMALATLGAVLLTAADGFAVLGFSASSPAVLRTAFLLLGFGLAPLYPTMMHDTPRRLGPSAAGRVIGLQVGMGFAGAAILPPLTGAVIKLKYLGLLLLTFLVLLALVHEASLTLQRETAKI